MNKESGAARKLGMFVIIGLLLFATAIYIVGKQKNLFGSTFHLRSEFKTVSGLKIGNNVRFSGINVGTVDDITLMTDTTVMVDIILKKEVQKFIKTDATASIGSDGLMGDKVFTIFAGTAMGQPIKDNDLIASKKAIEMEDVMQSAKTSVDNAGIITAQLADFTYKMNNSHGILTKLISDETLSTSLINTVTNLQTTSGNFAAFTAKMNDGKLGKALDSTISNIQGSTKKLDENMEAVQHNFLLRGFFKKKRRAEAKKLEQLKKEKNSQIAKDSTRLSQPKSN